MRKIREILRTSWKGAETVHTALWLRDILGVSSMISVAYAAVRHFFHLDMDWAIILVIFVVSFLLLTLPRLIHVFHRRHDEAAKPFELVKAVWGAASTWVDVTQKIQDVISGGRTIIEATTRVFEDPICGRTKTLKITYRLRGNERTDSILEGECFNLPTDDGIIRPPLAGISRTPAQPTTSAIKPFSQLEIEAERAAVYSESIRGKTLSYYYCHLELKNTSAEVLNNLQVKLRGWEPKPSQPHTGTIVGFKQNPKDPSSPDLPMPDPSTSPIPLKPESGDGRSVNPGDSVSFWVFKMVRTLGAPVEIIGAERQYRYFQPSAKWYTFDVQVSTSKFTVRQRFQLTFVPGEKNIPAFEVSKATSAAELMPGAEETIELKELHDEVERARLRGQDDKVKEKYIGRRIDWQMQFERAEPDDRTRTVRVLLYHPDYRGDPFWGCECTVLGRDYPNFNTPDSSEYQAGTPMRITGTIERFQMGIHIKDAELALVL
jgi:hypothetical protein